nr:uncharacterized protein LOC124813973 [Hydra vulgaris]
MGFVEMVRNYLKSTQKQSKTYSESELKRAIKLVNGGEPYKRVTKLLNIRQRTLRCCINGLRKSSVVGRKSSLLPDEEMSTAQYIATFSDFGFLNKSGRDCPYFKENMPGDDWVRSFLERHKSLLFYRACQNICRKRAAISCDSVNRFFNNLEDTIKNFLPQNIINYDETNLSDDPKSKQIIFQKVYKAERLMDTWILGGPIGARYDRTKSGWFDGYCFIDWLQTIVIPYFRHVDNNTPKLLVGDNLACHLSINLIEICVANNIRMVFLPPNSTHILQPLDLAVYGPMKSTWIKNLVSSLVLEHLAELRKASAKKPGAIMRRKKVKVSPGKKVFRWKML